LLERFHKKTHTKEKDTEQETSQNVVPEKDTEQKTDIPENDNFVSETNIIISEKEKLQINTDLFDNCNENESESIKNSPLSSIDSIPECCIPAYKEPIPQNQNCMMYGHPFPVQNDDAYEPTDMNINESILTNNSPFSSVDSYPFYPNLNKINEDDENSDPTELQNEKIKLHLPILNVGLKNNDDE
jgi:hypothetical protein